MTDLLVIRDCGIVRLVLNRPQRKNAMLPNMWDELTEVLTQIDGNPADRAVIVSGAGSDFCSGADVAARRNGATNVMSTEDLMGAVARTVHALHNLSKPTIAAVDGVAAGGGCNLALGCDFVLASDRARFSQIFVRRGLVVDTGGSWLLPRLVGLSTAKRLVLLGDSIDAVEALRLGMVWRVVPPALLLDEADSVARTLIEHDPDVMAADKKLIHDAMHTTLDVALQAEAEAQLRAVQNPNSVAAIQRFLKRRA